MLSCPVKFSKDEDGSNAAFFIPTTRSIVTAAATATGQ
ncbi:hypothetical protein SLEP1_g655 [Rubroshorea leprosula]|uniref:Uncharacterized protein n=1 Tax=Rubroshorea leprosula TaxID=152421 RepID=A0AAV5HFZ6_9ROSI|nr:hypothetical protein SLEP1_g655 [Rubroshorea leprosula]